MMSDPVQDGQAVSGPTHRNIRRRPGLGGSTSHGCQRQHEAAGPEHDRHHTTTKTLTEAECKFPYSVNSEPMQHVDSGPPNVAMPVEAVLGQRRGANTRPAPFCCKRLAMFPGKACPVVGSIIVFPW